MGGAPEPGSLLLLLPHRTPQPSRRRPRRGGARQRTTTTTTPSRMMMMMTHQQHRSKKPTRTVAMMMMCAVALLRLTASSSGSSFAEAGTPGSGSTSFLERRAKFSKIKPIRYPFASLVRGGGGADDGDGEEHQPDGNNSDQDDVDVGSPPIMSTVKAPPSLLDGMSNRGIATAAGEEPSAAAAAHATNQTTGADVDTSTESAASDPATAAAATAAPSPISSSPAEVKAAAALLRARGKRLHDAGDYAGAATQFGAAADLLLSSTDADEFATCRLHQALCCLKSRQHGAAVAACTAVLELPRAPAAVRARAGLRRAKARLALNETVAALEDARQAAFWGDRKAVALYGQLLREHRAGSAGGSGSGGGSMSEAFPFFPPTPQQRGEESGSPFEATAMQSSQQGSNNVNNAALFESLLSKSSQKSDDKNGMGGFSPASILQGMAAGSNGKAGGGGGGGGNGELAKSVLQKLSKKLDDEATQQQICGYLQNCNAPMLQTLARMAGLPLAAEQAQKLAGVARAVTVRRLRRGVKYTKRLVYAVQLLRKLRQVLQKYRHWLILYAMFLWTKSAVLRPLPVNRRALKRATARQRRGGGAAVQRAKQAPPTTAPENNHKNNNNKPAGMPVLLQQNRI